MMVIIVMPAYLLSPVPPRSPVEVDERPVPVLDLNVDEGRPDLLHHVRDEVVTLTTVYAASVLPTTAAAAPLAGVASTTVS